MANGNRGGAGSADVRIVLSSPTRESSCAFMAAAAAARVVGQLLLASPLGGISPDSAALCLLGLRVSCLIICRLAVHGSERPADAVRAHLAARTKATSSAPSLPPLPQQQKRTPPTRPCSVRQEMSIGSWHPFSVAGIGLVSVVSGLRLLPSRPWSACAASSGPQPASRCARLGHGHRSFPLAAGAGCRLRRRSSFSGPLGKHLGRPAGRLPFPFLRGADT